MNERADPSPALREPAYGVGFSYRAELWREVLAAAKMFDFLELACEEFTDAHRRSVVDPGERHLALVTRRFPTVAHATTLSIGSADPLDERSVSRLARFADRTNVAALSEHLSFNRTARRSIKSFIPLPFTDLGVEVATTRIRELRDRVGLPVLVENVSYHFAIPGSAMSEAEFVSEVAERADCGILLDVANLHINARNHGYDPFSYIDALPGERVQQAHFCGATEEHGYLLDTHFEATPREVLSLLDHALGRTALHALILERDREYRPFRRVLDEVWKAREVFDRHRPPRPRSSIRRAPSPAGSDRVANGGRSEAWAELARFQDALIEMAETPSFARRVFREGERALGDRGLGEEQRRALARIPRERWRWLAEETVAVNAARREYAARRRLEEFARWRRILGQGGVR